MVVKISRRKFLSAAAALGAAAAFGDVGTMFGSDTRRWKAPASVELANRKLIIILFGGGTRSSESIDDPEHCYIPRLWGEMVPKGTLFTNMRVEHRVVHPNSAGSIMTGHWEWDDLDWTRPVAHPTIFEIYRKARHAPDTATWAFVYASILARTGESLATGYGSEYAANVVEPPTIPRATSEEMDRRMQYAAAPTGGGSDQTGLRPATDAQVQAAYECAKLARTTSRISLKGLRSEQSLTFIDSEYNRWKAGTGSTSHDAFLAELAIACMRTFAPSVIAVNFGEIDCAHYGSWSRYVEAIRRTDELAWRIWQVAEELQEYRGQTLMLILPDHGREMDRPGHWGFIHHGDFYTNEGADGGCRRVWMVALGPGVKAGARIEKPVPITTVAATGLEFLGLEASAGSESSVWGLISV